MIDLQKAIVEIYTPPIPSEMLLQKKSPMGFFFKKQLLNASIFLKNAALFLCSLP